MPTTPPTNPGRNPEYLRPSPVRGQLEPQDSNMPLGWRYIQTTDTPDEFKVLLPPGTAAMYEYLLKLEAYELTKKTTINWERLMQIRHLKDRMIRKCQRLGNISTASKKATHGGAFVFQSLAAPSDFRLKEMEKWFREQQKRVAAKETKRASSLRESRAAPQSRSQALVALPKPPSRASSNQPSTHRRQRHSKPPKEDPPRVQQSITLPSATQHEEASPAVFSPDPLPMLLLAQREEYGLEPSPVDPMAGERVDRFIDSDMPASHDAAGSGANSPESNVEEQTPGSGSQLRRRRSALRRSNSDLSKRVSWADASELDQQISRYAAAARHVQASGTWGEVRTLYLEQIHALNKLHEQVKEGMDQLRVEAEHLSRIEETIVRQRRCLQNTFNEFESKHNQFRLKVREAISESTNHLTNTNTTTTTGRRELELSPINEISFNEAHDP